MEDINIIVMLLIGLIWLLDAWKLRKNVYSLCNVGSFSTCHVNACVTRRECCGMVAICHFYGMWQMAYIGDSCVYFKNIWHWKYIVLRVWLSFWYHFFTALMSCVLLTIK